MSKGTAWLLDPSLMTRDRKVSRAKLTRFGFKKSGAGYVYSVPVLAGAFVLTVSFDRAGRFGTSVTDAVTGQEYALYRNPEAVGAFVGGMREACGNVLEAIAAACCERETFKTAGAKEAVRYATGKYGGELEFLWEKFPRDAVIRRQDNDQWYVLLVRLPLVKLGLSGGVEGEILVLRGDPERIPALLDGRRYLPAYHMNKKTWFTFLLDGKVSGRELHGLIDASYGRASE